jgi:hypothetical protein
MTPMPPMKGFEDFQKISQTSMDTSMKLMTEWTKGWQTIAAEMSEYTKRSMEHGSQHMEKLMGVKSIDQVVELQSTYAKRAYDDYMAQVAKMNGIYADLAKEAYKPMERAIQSVQVR